MRLHFSIGGYDYRRTARFRQSIHFSITQVLFAGHMHRRSRQQILFPLYQGLMQAGTYFPKVRRMLIFLAPLISTHFWPASTLLREAPCSCHSVSSWDRSSNFGALGLRWWGSPGQIFPSDGFWSRILVWRTIAFVNLTRWIGFCMSELFRKTGDNFGGSLSWNTQPNYRVFDDLHPTGPCFNSWRVVTLYNGLPRSIVTFVTVNNRLPCSIVQVILLQHGYCTFVTFTRLFINLSVCIRAHFPKSASIF